MMPVQDAFDLAIVDSGALLCAPLPDAAISAPSGQMIVRLSRRALSADF